MAQQVAALAGNDGQEYPEAFTAALKKAGSISHESRGVYGAPVRYEFSDGSAIVDAADGWDFGVHLTRPKTAASRYAPCWTDETPTPIQFAWVGAGYRLTEDDALPAEPS